jgi:hypothetical protein
LHAASKPHEVELRKHSMTDDFTSSQGWSHDFLLCPKLLYRIQYFAIRIGLQQIVCGLLAGSKKCGESAQ